MLFLNVTFSHNCVVKADFIAENDVLYIASVSFTRRDLQRVYRSIYFGQGEFEADDRRSGIC